MKIIKEARNPYKIEKKTPYKVYLEFINYLGDVTGGALLAQFRFQVTANEYVAKLERQYAEDIKEKSVRIRLSEE